MVRNAAWWMGVTAWAVLVTVAATVMAEPATQPTTTRPTRATPPAATKPAASQPARTPTSLPASRPAAMPTPDEMTQYHWVMLSEPPKFSPEQYGFESVAVRDGVVLINKNGGRGLLDLTVSATSQPADETASTTSRPASLSPDELVWLLADLGGADWERAERAAMELARYDQQAESAIRDALQGVVNETFEKRAAAVLERIYAARVKIAGVWEEDLWANVKYKQQVTITADAKGDIALSPAPGARYQQYKYAATSFDGTTLKFHVRTNPDFEFDVELKLTADGELTGTRTRTATGESWDFRMTKVRDL